MLQYKIVRYVNIVYVNVAWQNNISTCKVSLSGQKLDEYRRLFPQIIT